jgi:DNA polymerase-3 subunit alpha
MIRVLRPRFWSVHTHSKYSYNDALPDVADIVARCKVLGQQAVGLTDHGNMAGSVELYTECMRAGLKPFPGSELYLVRSRRDKKAKRYHVGVVAYTTQGYKNLVHLSTLTHKNFHHKPLIDLADMAELSELGRTEGIALTTGCYFGLVAQTMVNEGYQAAKQLLATLATWWPSTYVELQNHDIDHGDGWNDDKLADALYELAQELGLPCVVTQDSHYVDERDRPDHDALKQLVSYGSDTDDAVFPGDGFHLADDAWMRAHHHSARLEAGLAGLEQLLNLHDLSIPALDRYEYRIPAISPDPDTELTQRCYSALRSQGLSRRYQQRLDEELGTIKAAGMSGYMLLTAQVTDYIHAQDIYQQTRGSAAGSLVCQLLGISALDPLKWGLRFERFLSKDRTKPPDIDLDIEHERRGDVIRWLETRYSVHQIGTWSELSMSGDEDGKGSLRVKYFAKMRQKGTPIEKWEDVSGEDAKRLYALSDRAAYGSYGKHPAGLVITATKAEFDDWVPLMWIASSETFVTQHGMEQIEALGFVKLDLLGSKTLTVVGKTLEQLGKPKIEGLEWIPNSCKRTLNMIKSGDTDGVFQLEGWSARKGVRRLKPTSIKDVIAAMALFRPATMDSGATEHFIARKHKEQLAPRRHQILADATKDTQGIVLYQDQVIVILRTMGMEADELTEFLKAVKKSNKKVTEAQKTIDKYLAWIHERGEELGFTNEDMDWLHESFKAFSEYGFNLAHSTVYGLTAYRTSYLAVHHPLEWHASLLNVWAGDKEKEPQYLKATRRRGLRIIRPEINTSGFSYTIDHKRKAIRKGLLSIKGVGKVAAQELIAHQPYQTVDDLVNRCSTKVSGGKSYKIEHKIEDANGTLRALHEAGALDSIV